MAKIMIKIMRIIEKGFIMRTRTLDTLGNFFCIMYPSAKGTISPIANVATLSYGMTKLPRSNICFPNVKIHIGINPKNESLHIVYYLEYKRLK